MPPSPEHEVQPVAVPESAYYKCQEVGQGRNEKPVLRECTPLVESLDDGQEDIGAQEVRESHVPPPPEFGQVLRGIGPIKILRRANSHPLGCSNGDVTIPREIQQDEGRVTCKAQNHRGDGVFDRDILPIHGPWANDWDKDEGLEST